VPIGAGSPSPTSTGNDRVTFTYFGDGAANQGQVYETFNMAELWNCRCLRDREQPVRHGHRGEARDDLDPRPLGHAARPSASRGEAVDGMDVLAVKAAGEKAVAHCRAGKGPYILEVMTYRYRGHSMSDPAKYRTREEVQKMREKRDAIEHVRQLLLTGKHATEDDLKAIDKEIKDIVNEAAEFAKESPEPALDELWTDIYADVAPQDA
jgi:pyruvate dehydrogenase E1 component alpha subunit